MDYSQINTITDKLHIREFGKYVFRLRVRAGRNLEWTLTRVQCACCRSVSPDPNNPPSVLGWRQGQIECQHPCSVRVIRGPVRPASSSPNGRVQHRRIEGQQYLFLFFRFFFWCLCRICVIVSGSDFGFYCSLFRPTRGQLACDHGRHPHQMPIHGTVQIRKVF